MEEQRLREELIALAHRLLENGLVVRTWGNFSARLDEETFLITPSGRSYLGMLPEDLVKVSLSGGRRIPGEEGKPSSEAPMHALVYALRADARFVIHTHQVFASALSLSPREFPLKGAWAECFGAGALPVSPYALPGTKKLHAGVKKVLSESPSRALLMGRHGALIAGSSAQDCLEGAAALEVFCREQYQRIVGRADLPRERIDAESPRERFLQKELQPRYPVAICISTDPALAYLGSGSLRPYLDDFAQICGAKASGKKGSRSVAFSREKTHAVCFGRSEEDARSVRAVLEKNVRAAHVAAAFGRKPIPDWECRLMRLVYQKKYSRLAGE